MMSDLIIKEPVVGDIGWLIANHGRLYSKQFGFDSQFEIDIARKVVSFHSHASNFDRLFIGHMNDERVGSIAVSQKERDSSFINFLLVDDRFRGQGIASVLLEKVLGYSAEGGMQRVFLETYSCLEGARNLYRKYGFEIFKTHTNISRYGREFDQEFWEKSLKA